jgi:uncharacterized protein YcaQ
VRIYAIQQHPSETVDAPARRSRMDALIDVIVRKYAPLPGPSLSYAVNRLRYAVPQWQRDVKSGLLRAKARLAQTHVDGIDWYWPAEERVERRASPDTVRLLAPFDPVVWDRRRFELFWGWRYRFEAYTPLAQRLRGYYALPLLWRDAVIGWGNVSVKGTALHADIGYVDPQARRSRQFTRELDAELERMREFLNLPRRRSTTAKASGAPDRVYTVRNIQPRS